MRCIALSGTDLRLSELAYGTATLGARLSRKESLALLERSFESGITHFDTARSYGYGETESIVGEFLRGRRRDQVTVATKCGIVPPKRTTVLAVARKAARALTAAVPAVRGAVRRRAEAMMQHGGLDPATLRESIETSLRELRVEYVDVLFLHEWSVEDARRDELMAVLHHARDSGKARYIGIATTPAQTAGILADAPAAIALAQFPWQAGNALPDGIVPGTAPGTIVHSVLGSAFAEVRAAFTGSEALRRRWEDELAVGFDDAALGGAMIENALHATGGAVLFSSRNDRHIDANVHRRPALDDERLRLLRRLLEDARRAAHRCDA